MDVFAALADPVRRGLLETLSAGPARVVDLAATRSISRPAVSRHLRLLGDAGLAVAEERGRERHYRLVPAAATPVRDYLDRLTVPPTGRIDETTLDALDLEVRRTVRERTAPATPTQETA